MRAVVFEEFGKLPEIRDVAIPEPARHGAVIRVEATGLCRSDWHGWQGHDSDVTPPHVPGHEFAGTIAALGAGVTNWRLGQRVTVPFVSACGSCPACAAGAQQVCERQTQPGFTHAGSFAEYVAVDHAAVNLVALPDDLSFATAAILGCRFATSFRAVVSQGTVTAGEWLAVYGCGGVGLSAVMIGVAIGARVIAIDTSPAALALAERFGAAIRVNAAADDPVEAVVAATSGGAHVAIDALGSPHTCAAAIRSLRRHGRHVQIGLLPSVNGDPAIPMERVIAYELTILGSHGMAAHDYPELLRLIASGTAQPEQLITRTIALDEASAALAAMDTTPAGGVTVIEPWR